MVFGMNRYLILALCSGLLLPSWVTAGGQKTAAAPKVTVTDVIKMTQVKLAEDLIIAQLRQNEEPLTLSADDMVRLKTAGVSDNVIRAMVAPRTANIASTDTGSGGSPVRPEEDEAKKLLTARVSSESEGRAVLSSFKKTDGQSAQFMGVTAYRMTFEGTVEFPKDCKWLRELFGGPLAFKTRAPQKANSQSFSWDDWFEMSQHPGILVKGGGVAGIAGTLTFERSENGWKLTQVEGKVVSEPARLDSNDRSSGTAPNLPTKKPGSSPTPNSSNARIAADLRADKGVMFVLKSDGSKVLLPRETGTGKYLFGARKVVELEGESSSSRVSWPQDVILLRKPTTPGPVGWDWRQGGMEKQCKVYVFEVSKGKRTAKVKDGIGCSAEDFASSGEFFKIVVKIDLAPGEYAFGPADPKFPSLGGSVGIIPFGVEAASPIRPPLPLSPVSQPSATPSPIGPDARTPSASPKRTDVNGVLLSPTEEEWIRFIAAKVRPALPGGLDAQTALVARSTWWSLKEGILDVAKPLEYSSCTVPKTGSAKAQDRRLGPLEICSGTVWQVGIGAVQVNNFTDAQVLAGISKLLPDRSVPQVLMDAATFAGFGAETDTGAKIISSTGLLQRSWLLRHPVLAAWFVEKNVTAECITGEKPWCFGTGWSQSKDYASTKEAALKSIRDLEAAFKEMVR